MGILSSIAGLAGGIPWVKVGIATLVIGGLTAGVLGIKAYGGQAEIIKQQKLDAKAQHDQYELTISALKEKNERDLASIQKEKDNALKLAVHTQQRLDVIKNVKPSDNGPTRPVLRDTLDWLRGTNSGDGNKNGHAAPAH